MTIYKDSDGTDALERFCLDNFYWHQINMLFKPNYVIWPSLVS